MSKNLEPCPFCGGDATAYQDNFRKVMVSCDECGAMLGVELEVGTELVNGWTATFDNPESAVSAWNHRAATEATRPCTACDYGGKHLDAPPCTFCPATPHKAKTNDPLTLEELNTSREPVWCACDSFDGEGGYWCLCQNGEITPPSCRPFLAKDRPNWVFYRRPPEGRKK